MNTKAKEIRRDIVGGPSRDRIFDACQYAYDKNAKVEVNFTAAAGYTESKESGCAAYIPMTFEDVTICSVSHEDGSGQSLILKGYCKADVRPFSHGTYQTYKFDMYYDARNRKGFVTLIEY